MFFDVVVQDVIKESDAVVKSLLEILPLYRCIFLKGIFDKHREIYVSKTAVSVILKCLLAAWVHSVYFHVGVFGRRVPLNRVPENKSGLGRGPC